MTDRKELKLTYKEAGTPMGLCQIKNLQNGKVYLESAMNVEGVINRSRFCLKHGSHHVRELQADWHEFGEAQFSIEVLEGLDRADLNGKDPKMALKALEKKWLERLQPYGERGYHREKASPKGGAM